MKAKNMFIFFDGFLFSSYEQGGIRKQIFKIALLALWLGLLTGNLLSNLGWLIVITWPNNKIGNFLLLIHLLENKALCTYNAHSVADEAMVLFVLMLGRNRTAFIW